MSDSPDRLQEDALRSVKDYMDSLDDKKKGILAYWIRDYVRFLKKEATFNPMNLVRYKRGSIVKAHLGYRIGSEEGGLHYAVVLDTDNAKSSQTVTVVPLTSLKPTSKPHPSKVPLGDELYSRLRAKLNDGKNGSAEALQNLLQRMGELSLARNRPDANRDAIAQERSALQSGVDDLNRKIAMLQKMEREINKLKTGSIALVGQITTISKIRIYDPLYPLDVLSGIRLSDESMDKLDAKLKELYTKK